MEDTLLTTIYTNYKSLYYMNWYEYEVEYGDLIISVGPDWLSIDKDSSVIAII